MSTPTQRVVVFREYKGVPDDCARRALKLLLTKSASKEGGLTTAPDDAKKGV
jgi:hypothetical protein